MKAWPFDHLINNLLVLVIELSYLFLNEKYFLKRVNTLHISTCNVLNDKLAGFKAVLRSSSLSKTNARTVCFFET